MAKPLTTAEIEERLRAKYADRGWALLFEVANGTGARAYRHGDALLMSVWPSRGIWCAGLEIKASRSDWVKEMKTPEKADAIFQYCDHWYLVVGDKNIVKPGELPKKWGLMVPHGKLLSIEVEAPQLDPKDWCPTFVASIMRNIAETHVGRREMRRCIDDARAEGFEDGKVGANYELKRLREWEKYAKEFEEASGIKLQHGWQHPKELGALVNLLSKDDPVRRLETLAKEFEKLAFKLRSAKERMGGA